MNDIKVHAFTTARPFEGEFAIIQSNAIRNWRALGFDVTVFIEREQDAGPVHDAGGNSRMIDLYPVPGAKPRPLFSDLFWLMQLETVPDDAVMLCANSDNLFLSDLPAALARLQPLREFKRFCMIGRRHDLHITQVIDFDAPDWPATLRSMAGAEGKLHGAGAIDWFAYRPRDLFGEIPPFMVGYSAYDNWMVWRARDQGAAVIDATEVVLTIDQSHTGQTLSVFHTPRAQENRCLAWGRNHTVLNATHRLTAQGLVAR